MCKGNFILDLENLSEKYARKIRYWERGLKNNAYVSGYKTKVMLSIKKYKEAKLQCDLTIARLCS